MESKQEEERRRRLSEQRRRYDERRALTQFTLQVHLPLTWREKGLSVSIRELCQALLDRQARAPKKGGRPQTIKQLIESATKDLESGEDGGDVAT